MPTYAYRCKKCEHEFEVFHGIKDDAGRRCPKCRSKAVRVPSGGAGLLFRGSGFYITDYRSQSYKDKAKQEKSDSGSAAKSDSGSGAKSDSGSSAKSDSGSAAKSERGSGSSTAASGGDSAGKSGGRSSQEPKPKKTAGH